MNTPEKNTTEHSSRSEHRREKKKLKKKRWFLKYIVLPLFVVFLVGMTYLYGTKPGFEFRKMMVGSVLSTQHTRYVKYMSFLLSKSQINTLRKVSLNPPTVQTTIAPVQHKSNISIKKKNIIKVDTINTSNYTAKVMTVSDPTTLHLVASKYTDKGQGLSDLISQNNGVAGINAGGFSDPGGNGSGGQPIGIVISNGQVLDDPGGKKSKELMCAFLKDGKFVTGMYSVNDLTKLGATQAVHFHPQLIVNGKNVVTDSIVNAWGWAPRTAIGQEENGTVVMIITDGRFYWNKTHRGASMSDIEKIMQSYHVVNAIAMDGGGSTTMIKDTQLLLKPATNTAIGMRYLPNAWVVIPNN